MRPFYRLEDSDGFGFYVAVEDYIADDFMDEIRHPGPKRDSKLWQQIHNKFSESLIFGFCSFDQYRAWFYNDATLRIAQAKHDIKLNKYEVDEEDSFVGNSQMVAYRNKIRLVGECDILTGQLK